MSSDLSGFLQQPFISSMLSFMCFFGLILLVVMVFIVRARTQKASTSTSPMLHINPDPNDLPDLDSLVGDDEEAPAQSLTEVMTAQATPPAPITAPTPPPAPSTPTSSTGLRTLHLKDGGQAQAVEVMTILRDVVGGNLIVQIGEDAYHDLNQDETFRNSFLKIMRELSPNVKGSSKPSAPAPTVAPTPPPAPATPPKAQAAPVVPPTVKGPLPGDLPKFESEPIPITPKGGFFNRGPKVEAKPIPEINIAGAIEAFLQHKLAYSPEYADREIHVYPAPDGGVAISVDGELYEAVGDVKDEDVRQFLTQTIQEWQSRN